MWLSDRVSGGASAYSKVSYQTLKQLKSAGHIVAHIPMAMASKLGKLNYEGILLYSSGQNAFGEDVALNHYVDFKADILITLKEPWVFNHIYKYAMNWVPIIPIDHSPVSQMITSRLDTAFKLISMSRFGQKELRHAGYDSTYIPHAVNTEIFRPLGEEKKRACKKLVHCDPDEFVVGVVARNQSRKIIPRMLRGYKRFLEMNQGIKSHMMLWTDVMPIRSDEPSMDVADVGVNLAPEIIALGLGNDVIWPDIQLIHETIPEWAGEDYVGGWDMVKLMSSFDVLLNCTGGEGFSLPLIEAQACGVPVITTEYAAAPEQVGAGLTVKADDYVILNTPGTRYALPSIDGMAEALTKIYKADRTKLAIRGRKFAERYSWPNVMEQYWNPFLKECEEELRPLLTKEGVVSWY